MKEHVMPSMTMTLTSDIPTSFKTIGSLGALEFQVVSQINGKASPSLFNIDFDTDFDLILDARVFESFTNLPVTLMSLYISFFKPDGSNRMAEIDPVEFRKQDAPNPDARFGLVTRPFALSPAVIPPNANMHITQENMLVVSLKTIARKLNPPQMIFDYGIGGLVNVPLSDSQGIPVSFAVDPRMIIGTG